MRYSTHTVVVQVFIMAMHVGGVIGAEGGGNGARHVSHSFSHCPPSVSSALSNGAPSLLLLPESVPLTDDGSEFRLQTLHYLRCIGCVIKLT